MLRVDNKPEDVKAEQIGGIAFIASIPLSIYLFISNGLWQKDGLFFQKLSNNFFYILAAYFASAIVIALVLTFSFMIINALKIYKSKYVYTIIACGFIVLSAILFSI